MSSISERANKVQPFLVMEVLERMAVLREQGRSVIPLCVGEPDFEPPTCVQEACVQAIQNKKIKYTHSMGLLTLRKAISEHYHQTYGVTVSPDQIIVTSGSSPALYLLFATLCNAGDEVILPDPHYPCYPGFLNVLDIQPTFVPVSEDNGFQYCAQDTRSFITPKTKAIIINSPSNPVGTLIPKQTLQELTELGPYIVSDEIYHGLVYEGKAHSILEFTQKAFVINGFSKAYAMTGYRLGYVIAPPEFVRPMQKIQQNLFISANTFVQEAGVVALRQGQEAIKLMRQELDQRRKFLLPELRRLGFEVKTEPLGAFYIFANAQKFTNDSYKFAFDLLEATGVGVTPGVDFGSRGEGYIRFSYATSLENIKEAIKRIEGYLKKM